MMKMYIGVIGHRLDRNGIDCFCTFVVVASLLSPHGAVRLAAPGVCQLVVVVPSCKFPMVSTTGWLCV